MNTRTKPHLPIAKFMPRGNRKITTGIRELQVMEQVEREPHVSQRTLAKRLGIALGMTNAILKRLTRKGFVKIKKISPNRLVYLMTPKGLSEKTNLILRYAGRTVDFYRRTKNVLVEQLGSLRKRGISRVAICGVGEMGEIVYLALRQLEMEVVCAVDGERVGQKWLGLKVRKMEDVPSTGAEAIVVTEPAGRYASLDKLKQFKIKIVRIGGPDAGGRSG